MTGASYNLARDALVTASSSYPTTPAGKAIDGIVDQTYPPRLAVGNFWSASSTCSPASPQWLRLELPQYYLTDQPIAIITVYNRGLNWCGDCELQQLVGAEIRILSDAGPSAVVVWNATVVDAALVHTFRVGLPSSDPLSYVHDSTTPPVSTLAEAPAPYPSATSTRTQWKTGRIWAETIPD
jgi:hypothetical protein